MTGPPRQQGRPAVPTSRVDRATTDAPNAGAAPSSSSPTQPDTEDER